MPSLVQGPVNGQFIILFIKFLFYTGPKGDSASQLFARYDRLPVQAYLTLQLAFGFYTWLHFLGVEEFGYVTVINTNCD